MGKTLLISLKPEFAEMVFAGSKTVELRRTRPSVQRGDVIAIYVSSPTKSLKGTATVARVVEASPWRLWQMVGKKSGISRSRFLAYFAGATRGYGIALSGVQALSSARPLTELRVSLPGFCPPQTYRYLATEEARLLGIGPHGNRQVAA